MKKTDDPELLRFLDIISHKVYYIKHLVVDILELARLNSPTVTLDKQELNLLDITKQVIKDNQLIFDEKVSKL